MKKFLPVTFEVLDSNKSLSCNAPKIFEKKKVNVFFKKLTKIWNKAGETRHFSPASQEWYNSIYAYNINYVKTLPIADINLMRILRNYFSIEVNHKIYKIKPMPYKFKRLSTKKIFVGRGDLKHTSSKVIITFYVYDTIKYSASLAFYLTNKALFYPRKRLIKTEFKTKDKVITTYNRILNLGEFLDKKIEDYPKKILGNLKILDKKLKLKDYSKKNLRKLKYIIKSEGINNRYLRNLEEYYSILTKLVEIKSITSEEKNKILIGLYDEYYTHYYRRYFSWNIYNYWSAAYEYYISRWKRLRFLLWFNHIKYNKIFISKLINLVEDIYGKSVEFNIVQLRKIHLNTDIYTQTVALKLENHKNRLYRVLKASLRKAKVPPISRQEERRHNVDKNKLLVNIIKNNKVSDMFSSKSKDPLSKLILEIFPRDSMKLDKYYRYLLYPNTELTSFIISTLKHLKVRGIRVEVKGRISKRFTAARSVFKMRLKGGLKNVDSSFKGIPAVMLRGHVKSNVDYAFISSKNRTGSYGVKGWLATK